jgi:hypothetical protein
VNLSELRTALQERREDYSSSAAKLDRKINQAYLDICSRRKWGWLRREYTWTTHPFLDGVVSVDATAPGVVGSYRIVPAGVPAGVCFAEKRVIIDGDTYTIKQVTVLGGTLSWVIDRPLICSAAIHVMKILFDEVALPVGTQTIIQSSLTSGSSEVAGKTTTMTGGTPLSMAAVSPSEMLHNSPNVAGNPSQFATMRKEPIQPPFDPPALVLNLAVTPLAAGTYTYWFTHVDNRSGAESALSPPASIANTAGHGINVTGAAAQDYFLRIYRSVVNGSTPFFLVDARTATYSPLQDIAPDFTLVDRGPNSGATIFARVYPVPDDNYDIHFVTQVEATPLGSDNDRPIFDGQFHNLILDGAEAMMLEASDEQRRATQSRQRLEMGIMRMVQMDRINAQQSVVFGGRRPLRGRPTWWYGAYKPAGP